MNSKQLFVAFWFYALLSFGCFASWLFLFFRFGGSLLEDAWLVIVGVVIGCLALADLYVYRTFKKQEGNPREEN
jgi:hypothetical protein